MIGFIDHVRKAMEWGDKKLNPLEVETLYAVLDSKHDKIIRGIQDLIDEFKTKDDQNTFTQKKKKTAHK